MQAKLKISITRDQKYKAKWLSSELFSTEDISSLIGFLIDVFYEENNKTTKHPWRGKAKKRIKQDVRRGKDMTYSALKNIFINAGLPEDNLSTWKEIEMRLSELYDFSKKRQTAGKQAVVFYNFKPIQNINV